MLRSLSFSLSLSLSLSLCFVFEAAETDAIRNLAAFACISRSLKKQSPDLIDLRRASLEGVILWDVLASKWPWRLN